MNQDHSSSTALQQFNKLVGTRFQLYNGLFMALPFHKIEKTGVLLTLFLMHCEEGYQNSKSPEYIVDSFVKQYTPYTSTREKLDLLFRFIQYAERQIVLFDALEDASFSKINAAEKSNPLGDFSTPALDPASTERKIKTALRDLEVRLVLTAHPTQFYPGEVLGIIHDLSEALAEDNTTLVNDYLRQLGKTPFLKKQKPTPYDEAMSLMWFLEQVFYPAAGNVLSALAESISDNSEEENNPLIRMGFWPGGDRDGNQYVKAATTLKVAQALKERLLRRYYHDIRMIKRRLTFSGVALLVAQLEQRIFTTLFSDTGQAALKKEEILSSLQQIKAVLLEEHNGLFSHLVDAMINKVKIFGLFFATLDIRQDSSVHEAMLHVISAGNHNLPADYPSLTDEGKIQVLSNLTCYTGQISLEDEVQQDILDVIRITEKIQYENGEEGCNRYIISHCQSALNVLEVYGLFLLSGREKSNICFDIIPLFETIQDLKKAAGVMQQLYENETYRTHLVQRNGKQTIMLGFSDGTKDGGYLMANWAIYKAKEALTKISLDYGIKVIFFDGRGGPPARGGGKTQKFYSSMGSNIASSEIQLTIQGQTISANFGNTDTAEYNIKQLIQAGVYNRLYESGKPTLSPQEDELLNKLAEESLESYVALKNDPEFLTYLSKVSPLRFYADTNIGSRPAKRNSNNVLTMEDLRAIPFVGAWSQLKQNVSGFYGVGSALQSLKEKGNWSQLKLLYKRSLFFKTLLDNCEMAIQKCFFPLTAHLSQHTEFGNLWNTIYKEYELTKFMILELSGKNEMMDDEPISRQSILMRERIVLPLLTIQQYGLTILDKKETESWSREEQQIYEKMILRCSFGIINAGRNSA